MFLGNWTEGFGAVRLEQKNDCLILRRATRRGSGVTLKLRRPVHYRNGGGPIARMYGMGLLSLTPRPADAGKATVRSCDGSA